MAVEPHARELRETHFALIAEPATAPPGGAVRLRYRLRNAGAAASPAARVQFLLPPGAAPEGALECALAPVPPGHCIDVELAVRIDAQCDDGTELIFQAVLLLDDAAPAGSNRARVTVRGAALLAGERTRITLARGDNDDEILVGAVLVNDGNASAHDVVLVLPPPLGTQSIEGPDVPTFHLGRLAAGARAEVAFRARIVGPPGPLLRAAGAYVVDAAGARTALPASDALRLDGFLAAPLLECAVDGRRVQLTLRACNAGWGALEQTTLVVRWPAGFHFVRESLEIDGAPAHHAVAERDALRLVIERIRASGSAEITFALYATSRARGGDVSASAGDAAAACTVRTPLPWTPRRAVSIEPVAQPETAVEAGAVARVRFAVRNAGDCTRRLTFATAREADVVSAGGKRLRAHERIALAPGAVKAIDVEAAIPQDAADGAQTAVELRVFDGGEPAAARAVDVAACDRVWFEGGSWLLAGDGSPRVELRNRGASTARGVALRFDDGDVIAVGDIAPGATGSAPLNARQALAAAAGADITWGANRTLRAGASGAGAAEAGAQLAVLAPATAHAGTAVAIVLHAVCPQHVRRLQLRVQRQPHVSVAPGSTHVNAHALADAASGPVLASDDGLVLHGVPGGTRVEVTLQIVADPAWTHAAPVRVSVHADADGVTSACSSEPIAVAPLPAFAANPHALPFLIDGVALAQAPAAASEDVAAVPPVLLSQPLPDPVRIPPPLRLAVRLDAENTAAMLRVLRGAPATGLVSHVLALRALFPTEAVPSCAALCEALASARDALRSVLDRLFVKVRIPLFEPCAADCEDVTARRSLLGVFAAVGEAAGAPYAADDAPLLWTAIDVEAARAWADELAHAPLGAARALGAFAALLPVQCDAATEPGRALARYAGALRAALESCADLAPAAYEERLARGRERALDDARAASIAALESAAAAEPAVA